MKISKDKHEEIKLKSAKLKKVSLLLKKEFIGLDFIIDEMINSIESWYLFPDGQIRPTVVNLWGMTGTGKTSLVKRLFELLEFGSVIKFDIGDWLEDNSNHQLKHKISSQLRKIKKEKNIPVFVFDEFQLGRNISKRGDDVDRSGLRIIWELIDSGKFDIVDDTWETGSLMRLYKKLSHCIEDNGVKCKAGSIIKNKSKYEVIFPVDEEHEEEKEYIKDGVIPHYKLWLIRKAWKYKFLSDNHLSEYIKELSDEKSILKFIEETLSEMLKPTEHDFSNSIVFNIGNLDEVYHDHNNMDPDIDADSLYELTKNITITDIKDALSERFRSEQIGRLGNNHIIYKSFSSQNYKDLIEMELVKIINNTKEKFDINITFTDRTKELLYNESVFPTQGARPIFSTNKNLVESYIGKIITECIKKKLDVIDILWDYNNEKYNIKLMGEKLEKTLIFNVVLKVDNLRKSMDDDNQALTAIHEAGHAIASIYSTNLCPKTVMSKTANLSGGFTYIESPQYRTKEFLINDIIVSLGGLVAEKLIFGEDNLTIGSYSDLKNITTSVVRMIKNLGMGDSSFIISHENFNDIINQGDIAIKKDKILQNIIEDCEKKCKKILEDNMILLLEMGKYLTKNSKIEESEIKKIVKKYGTIVEYKDKDNYYDFKNIIDKKLKKLTTNNHETSKSSQVSGIPVMSLNKDGQKNN